MSMLRVNLIIKHLAPVHPAAPLTLLVLSKTGQGHFDCASIVYVMVKR
jgi:hypothetical protein